MNLDITNLKLHKEPGRINETILWYTCSLQLGFDHYELQSEKCHISEYDYTGSYKHILGEISDEHDKRLLNRFEQSIQHSLFIDPKVFRGVIKNCTLFCHKVIAEVEI